MVCAFTEVDPTGEPARLREQVQDRVHALAAAGADSVIFHATGAAPDARPLIEALARKE